MDREQTPAQMPEQTPMVTCPVCGRPHDATDPEGPCPNCRKEIVRSSARWAMIPAALVALAYGWLLVWSGLVASPFLIVWLAFGAVLAFIAYKVGHRVAFDAVRVRAERRAARR
jgi:fatty acid desaturase